MPKLFSILLLVALSTGRGFAADTWRTVAPGLEVGRFPARAAAADSGLVVLRIDPAQWELDLYCAGEDSAGGNRTAREWCRARGLTAAINAGMYLPDYRTHVGFLQSGDFRSGAPVRSYRSVAAFAARDSVSPAFGLHDFEESIDLTDLRARYRCVVQNLRLIRHPGENVWQPSDRRWSEAALGEDAAGRALFIFCREAHSMHELNRRLLELPLDLLAAQHLEGGRQAQLYVEHDGRTLDLCGGGDTGSFNDGLPAAWPIPNVIGLRPRSR